MKPIIASRTIDAPLSLVFQTVSDVRNFRKAVPHITNVEFLSEQQHGVGTRFRETRMMKGREQSVELEVAEFADNERVRMVSDAGGTVWDTLFTVSLVGDAVELKMQMDIRPHAFLARLMIPLIRGMVVKGVESDMDAVKSYCESGGEPCGAIDETTGS
ncbi:Polyketide cyclase / dehydrase and lipid transport [Stieleria neptunia]|uniref:Polyketide cyclase / dehydrase and lipid transport n=1 Tax=Stieleria neptunia TaxID=2527979 RepID=A0A518I3Z3_9BACT|nr:SRPBCC family protein [Stieleria neptunia]QDV47776.1 Polyketide cyclase / dehydrase and lipid transport [Stieleria neptunia]